jgi:CheY-like chemotaxis protein
MSIGHMSTEPIHGAPGVLIVEDDPDTRGLLREVLESEGLTIVGEAESGERAIELARLLEPDVILMDIRLPGINGIEATRVIKDANPSIQVIALTAYEELMPIGTHEELGIYVYLLKDCSPQLMRDMIHRAWWHAKATQAPRTDDP